MINTFVVYDRTKLLTELAKGLQKDYVNHVIYTQDLETAQMAVRQKAIDSPSQGIALIVTLPNVNEVARDYENIETFARIKPDVTIIVVMTQKVQAMFKLSGEYEQGFGSQYLTLPVTTGMIDKIFNQIC